MIKTIKKKVIWFITAVMLVCCCFGIVNNIEVKADGAIQNSNTSSNYVKAAQISAWTDFALIIDEDGNLWKSTGASCVQLGEGKKFIKVKQNYAIDKDYNAYQITGDSLPSVTYTNVKDINFNGDSFTTLRTDNYPYFNNEYGHLTYQREKLPIANVSTNIPYSPSDGNGTIYAFIDAGNNGTLCVACQINERTATTLQLTTNLEDAYITAFYDYDAYRGEGDWIYEYIALQKDGTIFVNDPLEAKEGKYKAVAKTTSGFYALTNNGELYDVKDAPSELIGDVNLKSISADIHGKYICAIDENGRAYQVDITGKKLVPFVFQREYTPQNSVLSKNHIKATQISTWSDFALIIDEQGNLWKSSTTSCVQLGAGRKFIKVKQNYAIDEDYNAYKIIDNTLPAVTYTDVKDINFNTSSVRNSYSTIKNDNSVLVNIGYDIKYDKTADSLPVSISSSDVRNSATDVENNLSTVIKDGTLYAYYTAYYKYAETIASGVVDAYAKISLNKYWENENWSKNYLALCTDNSLSISGTKVEGNYKSICWGSKMLATDINGNIFDVTNLTPELLIENRNIEKLSADIHGSYTCAIDNDGKVYQVDVENKELKELAFNSVQEYPIFLEMDTSYSGQVDITGSNYTVSTAPAHGTLTFDEADNGKFTYVPESGWGGKDMAAFTVDLGGGDIKTFYINFTVNNTPTFSSTPLSVTALENTVYNGAVSGFDADGDSLLYSVKTQASKGAVVIDESTGAYTYTPNTDIAGNDTFEIEITDGLSAVSKQISMHIESVIQTNDTKGTNFHIDVTNGVSDYTGNVGATDKDGDSLTYSISTIAKKGVVNIDASGNYTYTPNEGKTGTDDFTVKIDDGVQPVYVTYSLTLYKIADKTSITDYKINQNKSFTAQMITEKDSVSVSYSIVSAAGKGQATVNSSSGAISYVANNGAAGADSFTVRTTYDFGYIDTVMSVYINTKPSANAVAKSIVTDENVTYNGSVACTDVDSDTLMYTLSKTPTRGNVSVNSATGAYTYIPHSGVAGNDSFSVKIADGMDEITVNVAVHIESEIVTNTVLSFKQNQGERYESQIVATDKDGDTLFYSILTNTANGILEINGSTGAYSYVSNANFYGADSFVVRVDDGVKPIDVTVCVLVNRVPIAAQSSYLLTGNMGTEIKGIVEVNDLDGDVLTYSIYSAPTKGDVDIDNLGGFTYTAKATGYGNDTFVVKIADELSEVFVTVYIHNETEIDISQNELNIVANQGKEFNGSVIAVDNDGDSLLYSLTVQAAKGVVTIDENSGAWRYVVNGDAKGTDSFTITVTDGVKPINVVYNVAINIPPVFSSLNETSVVTNYGVAYNATLIATDENGDTLTYSVKEQAAKGIVEVNATTGGYVYTNTTGKAGDDSFTIQVSDGYFSAIIVIAIHVETEIDVTGNVTDLVSPVGESINDTLSAVDLDGDALSYSIKTNSTKGTLEINATTGQWEYIPNVAAKGTDSFTLAVTDGVLEKTVTYTVDIDIPPIFTEENDNNIVVNYETTYNGELKVSHDDNGVLMYSIVQNCSKGEIVLDESTGVFTYDNLDNLAGDDSFTVKVTDGCFEDTLVISVHIETAVAFEKDSYDITLDIGTDIENSVKANDLDGDSITYSISTEPQMGTIVLNTDGSYTYFADKELFGSDSCIIKVTDGNSEAYTTIQISILTLPAFTDVSTNVVVGKGLTITGNVKASDRDDTALTYSIATEPRYGEVSVDAQGVYSYTAYANNIEKEDSFIVNVSDGVHNVQQTVSIILNNIPVAKSEEKPIKQNGEIKGKITVEDMEGDTLTFTVVQDCKYGKLTLNATTGEYSYKGKMFASGTDTFKVKVSDGINETYATITVEVEGRRMVTLFAILGSISATIVLAGVVLKLLSKMYLRKSK